MNDFRRAFVEGWTRACEELRARIDAAEVSPPFPCSAKRYRPLTPKEAADYIGHAFQPKGSEGTDDAQTVDGVYRCSVRNCAGDYVSYNALEELYQWWETKLPCGVEVSDG